MIVRNFLFHRVTDKPDELWPPMKVALFDRIIRHITENYTPVCIEDIVTKKILPDPSLNYATISFDDGYKDNLTNAAVILKKYNCAASFYVVTDCIEHNTPTWTYKLDYSIINTSAKAVQLKWDGEAVVFNLNTKKDRLSSAKKIKPALKKLNHQARQKTLDELFGQLGDVSMPQMMMNWNDVKQLIDMGFHVGSHSKSHLMLKGLPDNLLADELIQSFESIVKHTGVPPCIISYPVGDFDENTLAVAKTAGYKGGLAVKQLPYNTETDSVFAIPRIELYNEPFIKCQLRMNGMLEKIKKMMP